MITCKIHLTNISQFRFFANMSARFHIAGYVLLQEEKINMQDILEKGQREDMLLVLTRYRQEELAELEKYMSETGILKDKEENTLKSV